MQGAQETRRFNPWVGKVPEASLATHSSTPVWKIPWIEEPGGLEFMGSQRDMTKHSMWKWKSLSRVRPFATPWTITVHGILQARILGWVAFPFSRGPPQLRDQTQVSCIAGRFFTSWATSIATLVIGVSFCFSAPITCRCSLLVVFTQNLFFNLSVYMTQFMWCITSSFLY